MLPNGKVLVTGGFDGTNDLHTASLFNPGMWIWSSPDSMFRARSGHTAKVLPNGRVLIAGGGEPLESLNLASYTEEYFPADGTFDLTLLIPTRQEATATLLHNGHVLHTGGNDNYYLSGPLLSVDSADVYDEGRQASTTPVLLSLPSSSPGAVLNLIFNGARLHAF